MQNNMDSCLICGKYVPEGRQVCYTCAVKYGMEEITGICSINPWESEKNIAQSKNERIESRNS